MRKELTTYRKKIDGVIASPDELYYDGIVEDHLAQISFFQHERIVHLHVTLAFAIMEMIAITGAALSQQLAFLVLVVLLLVLLVPYIVHYYFLENETQKLYPQYEELRKLENERKLR